MLINRTYRTWLYDYPQYYTNISTGGILHPSKCPNNISSLITSISNSGDFTANGFITTTINGDLGAKNNYIVLYDGNTSGIQTDPTNPFYGYISNIGTDVVSNGFLRFPVNGIDSYVRIYSGSSIKRCCSNLRGSLVSDTTGSFIEYGFAAILLGGTSTVKYIQIFTLDQ